MELGKLNVLTVDRIKSVGAFLKDDNNEDVLLPKKEIKGLNIGDKIEVFILKDNENRIVATTRKPLLQVGEIGLLKCVSATKIGAFLDIGLDRDLFLPIDEQLRKVKENDLLLVRVYIDEISDRLCRSMKVKGHFQYPSDIKENDWINGVVYNVNPEIGAFILAEGKYDALLAVNEMDDEYEIGEEVHLRVSNIKKDGKIDLTYRNRSEEEISTDSRMIYNMLLENGGYLEVNDYSSPRTIKKMFGLSKSQFKRAIGHLLKLNLIRFKNDGIEAKNRGKNGR